MDLEEFERIQDKIFEPVLEIKKEIDWEERERKCKEEQSIINMWREKKRKKKNNEYWKKRKEEDNLKRTGILSYISTDVFMSETDILKKMVYNEDLCILLTYERYVIEFLDKTIISTWGYLRSRLRAILNVLIYQGYLLRDRWRNERTRKQGSWVYIKKILGLDLHFLDLKEPSKETFEWFKSLW